MKCLDPFGRTADVMAGIFEIIAATLSRVARKREGRGGLCKGVVCVGRGMRYYHIQNLT